MVKGVIYFVGMGVYNEKGLTIEALEVLRSVDLVFAETYTSRVYIDFENLKRLIGKEIVVLGREEVEEKGEEIIIKPAETGKKVAFLSPGDCFIATTHMALRLEACRRGIKTYVVHAPSIYTVAPALTGLHIYKFGRCVTLPFPENGYTPRTPYNVIKENKERGLHTLILLDVNDKKKTYMTVNQALRILLSLEEKYREKVITEETVCIGVARAGSPNPTVKVGTPRQLAQEDFGETPHCLIIAGQLHFTEAEALIELWNAPKDIIEKNVGRKITSFNRQSRL